MSWWGFENNYADWHFDSAEPRAKIISAAIGEGDMFEAGTKK